MGMREVSFLLLGVFLGALAGLALPMLMKYPNLFLPLVSFGAFGGLLYSARQGRLAIPSMKSDGSVSLGWLADVGFGAAGAFVVFLILPGEIKPTGEQLDWALVRIFAVAIVGGYAGRAVISRAIDDLIKETGERMEALGDRTDEQAARVMASMTEALSEEDFERELARIIEKEERRGESSVSLVYADVNKLKPFLAGRDDAWRLKIEILEALGRTLTLAAGRRRHDVYDVRPGEPDRVLVLREIKGREETQDITHEALREFKKTMARDPSLRGGKPLTATAAVLHKVALPPPEGEKHWQTDVDADARRKELRRQAPQMHRQALDVLERAKNASDEKAKNGDDPTSMDFGVFKS